VAKLKGVTKMKKQIKQPEHFQRYKYGCNNTWKGNISGYGECVFTVVGTYKNVDPVVCIFEPQEHCGKRVAINWNTGQPITDCGKVIEY